MIKAIIQGECFVVNHSKTRVAGAARRKIVTGLVISEDNIGIGKQKYKELRAKIHHLASPLEKGNTKLLNEVRGWLSYLNSVDKKRLSKAEKYIKELSKTNPNSLVAKLNN